MKALKRYGVLTLVIFILAVVFGVLGEVWCHGKVVSEHLFTEMVATWFTVVAVEWMLHRNKEKDELPRRATTYTDICSFLIGVTDVWYWTYRESVPVGEDPNSMEVFFTEKNMQRIWVHLNVDASVPKHIPPQRWMVKLTEHGKWIGSHGQILLGRIVTVDARVYADVHALVNSMPSKMFPIMSEARAAMRIIAAPQPPAAAPAIVIPNLKSFCPEMPQEELAAIRRLIDWCVKEKRALDAEGVETPVQMAYRAYREDGAPHCGINEAHAAIQWALIHARANQDKNEGSLHTQSA